MSPSLMRSTPATKGVDPNGHDMSSAEALAKNFGVSESITSTLKLHAVHEELPVDPNALPKLEVKAIQSATLPMLRRVQKVATRLSADGSALDRELIRVGKLVKDAGAPA